MKQDFVLSRYLQGQPRVFSARKVIHFLLECIAVVTKWSRLDISRYEIT